MNSGEKSEKWTSWLVNVVIIWQILVAILGVGMVTLLLMDKLIFDGPGWTNWVAGIILGPLSVASGYSAYQLWRHKRSGRTASLVVNFLGFIVCLLALLQISGFFLSVDALAETFGHGLIPLAGVLIGYLVYSSGDRFHSKISVEEWLHNAGKIIALVGFIIFLLRVGMVQGLIVFAQRLVQPATIFLTILTLLFAFMVWAMWREGTGLFLHRNNAQTEALEGYLFLAPNLLGFLIFFAFPLAFSFFISLTDWDAFGNKNLVGLANYFKIFNFDLKPLTSPDQAFTSVIDGSIFSEVARFKLFAKDYVFGAADPLFWTALRNTLVFGLVTVPLSAIPALLLANILNSKIPGMKFFRAVYFLPSIAATVGIALIWQWLYNATIGYINYFITIGINFFNLIFGTANPAAQIRWLSESRTALLAIIIVAAWQTMGYNTVLFMAGLQNIPKELYEAATVDGAGPWAKFWKVTLPLLAPTTFFVITTTTIMALQAFEQVYIMTNPPGGPGTSTLTIVLYLYQNGFQRFRQGYAAAIAWVLFIIIFAVTFMQFRSQRKTGAYDL